MGDGEGGMFQENSIETCILSRVKQNTSPGWMHETSARTWCSGRTWRERVEREVGGGMGMGKTCEPMAVWFNAWQNSLQKKKKKKNRRRLSNGTNWIEDLIAVSTLSLSISSSSFCLLSFSALLPRPRPLLAPTFAFAPLIIPWQILGSKKDL